VARACSSPWRILNDHGSNPIDQTNPYPGKLTAGADTRRTRRRRAARADHSRGRQRRILHHRCRPLFARHGISTSALLAASSGRWPISTGRHASAIHRAMSTDLAASKTAEVAVIRQKGHRPGLSAGTRTAETRTTRRVASSDDHFTRGDFSSSGQGDTERIEMARL
jgi:hypothetical protein